MTAGTGDVPVGAVAMVEAAQLAVGVLAARARDDMTDAEALLAAFPSADARVLGFLLVSELALALLGASSDTPRDELCRRLALDIEGALRFQNP